jgi:hypothetical protein
VTETHRFSGVAPFLRAIVVPRFLAQPRALVRLLQKHYQLYEAKHARM